MSSAANLILGVSILAMGAGFAACDNGSSDNGGASNAAAGGPVVVPGGGSGNGSAGAGNNTSTAGGAQVTAGAPGTGGAPAATGGTGAVILPEGVPLTPTDGWVDAASNILGVVGAMYAYADDTSAVGMTSTFLGATGCMKGTAAKVIDPCTIAATASDCFGTYWGAAIGLNLNQPKDPATDMGVKVPLPFDASMLKGFAFEIEGATVPAPKSLRFKVENDKGEFCTPPTQKVKVGANVFLFKDLLAECWHTTEPANATAETAQSALLKISWAVVTSKDAEVPFDFCVSNIVALPKDGVTITPVVQPPAGGAPGAGGAPAAAAGSPAGGAAAG